MRFVVALLAATIAVPASAVTMPCSYNDGNYSCSFPIKADLGFSEVHIDRGGTYSGSIKFATPLSEATLIEGFALGHFDEYDAAGTLVDGNTSADYLDLLNTTLGSGSTRLSFLFSFPDAKPFFSSNNPYAFAGYTVGFNISAGATPLPKLTFNVDPMSVPEPSAWAMMIAGFGAIGPPYGNAAQTKACAPRRTPLVIDNFCSAAAVEVAQPLGIASETPL